jgi:hypothetical protein
VGRRRRYGTTRRRQNIVWSAWVLLLGALNQGQRRRPQARGTKDGAELLVVFQKGEDVCAGKFGAAA